MTNTTSVAPSGAAETCEHDYHWYPAPCDEAGWRCVGCGERPGEPSGYSPHLDRSLTSRKVSGILTAMHDAGIIHVSNGSSGDRVAALVADACVERGHYDSVSIAFLIIQLNYPDDRHLDFWREQGDAIVSSADPRPRCHCGALATWTRVGGGPERPPERGCAAHSGGVLDGLSAGPSKLS